MLFHQFPKKADIFVILGKFQNHYRKRKVFLYPLRYDIILHEYFEAGFKSLNQASDSQYSGLWYGKEDFYQTWAKPGAALKTPSSLIN